MTTVCWPRSSSYKCHRLFCHFIHVVNNFFTATSLWSRSTMNNLRPTLPVRSYQCPTDSCWIPVIPAESSAFRRNGNWQRALPILPFRLFPIPVESLHSGIDTGMFPGIHRNRMQPEYIFRNCI